MPNFFFNDTATTEIYALSLHDALPICPMSRHRKNPLRPLTADERKALTCLSRSQSSPAAQVDRARALLAIADGASYTARSEEHTSELQSRQYLVCRLLLEKKNNSSHAN